MASGDSGQRTSAGTSLSQLRPPSAETGTHRPSRMPHTQQPESHESARSRSSVSVPRATTGHGKGRKRDVLAGTLWQPCFIAGRRQRRALGTTHLACTCEGCRGRRQRRSRGVSAKWSQVGSRIRGQGHKTPCSSTVGIPGVSGPRPTLRHRQQK